MSVQLRHPRLHDLRCGESAASHQPNRLLSPFAGFGTLKTSAQRGALAMEHSSFADRLRKSYSSEPLDRQREISSTSSSSDERAEHSLEATRLARRLHSASMNQMKSRSNLDKEVKFADQNQHIEPATLKMDSMAADDVFTDILPHRRLLAQTDSPYSPHVVGGGELATTFNDGTQAVDAQGIYPPSACVFVANLTQLEPDIVLESEVTRIFSEFGTVFVKIRRDQKNMPFAFCQFTTDHDARTAVAHSSGKIILGRPCRVEKAKANSTFILYKHSGAPTDETEAFYLMEPLGDIASIVPLDSQTQNEMQLPGALLVQFRMYDPKRDVRQVARRDPRFMVREYEPAVAASPQARRETRIRAEEMAEYDRDRRSAYFGNLPVDMSEDELYEMAITCGQIRNRRLYHKTYRGGPTPVCFAFVEFARPDSVDEVIRTYHGAVVRGHMIKVERKLSRCFAEAPERDSRLSNRMSNYTPASKSWRASELDYAGPNRLPYTPTHTKHRQMPELPVGNPTSSALSTPHEKTYEHAATFAHRRPQSQSFMIPSNSRRPAYETPTRPGHSASIFGTMRPRAPARLHAKDIFERTDEQDGATSRPFHQQESFIQAHRDALASYQRKEAFANEVREASRNDGQGKMHVESWINQQNLIKTAELVQEMYQGKFAGTLPRTVPGTFPGRLARKLAPSEDGTDNESGGAVISPETQPSTLADMSSAPDVSSMSISDESAKPRVPHHVEQNMKHHDQPPPYSGFSHMAYHPLQMHHPLSLNGPPVTPYSHHTVASGRMMPYLPTPYPDIQGNVMISPTHRLHAGVREELDPVTPTRFGPVGSSRAQGSVRGKTKTEQQGDNVKPTVIEPSPSRAAETPRFQAQCHARRESQETRYEPEKSSGNSNTNSESEE